MCLLGAAIGAGASYYISHNQFEKKLLDVKLQAEQRAHDRRSQEAINNETLQNRLNQLESQKVMDDASITELQAELQKSHDQLKNVTQRLAFYENMDESSPNTQVSLRNIEIKKLDDVKVQFKVLLSRSADDEGYFDGRLQFIAEGKSGDKPQEVELLPLSEESQQTVPEDKESDTEPLSDAEPVTDPEEQLKAFAVHVQRLQMLEGVLAVPEDFQPDTVTLNVLQNGRVAVSRKTSLKP